MVGSHTLGYDSMIDDNSTIIGALEGDIVCQWMIRLELSYLSTPVEVKHIRIAHSATSSPVDLIIQSFSFHDKNKKKLSADDSGE